MTDEREWDVCNCGCEFPVSEFVHNGIEYICPRCDTLEGIESENIDLLIDACEDDS